MEISFSASKYKTAQSCLGKYYFRYIAKENVKEIVWPGTVYGSALHLFIEENLPHLKGKNIKNKIVKPFSSCWEEEKASALSDEKRSFGKPRGFKEDEFLSSGSDWAFKCLSHIYSWIGRSFEGSVSTHEEERSFEVKRGDVTIKGSGIIDFKIKESSGEVHIFDFKTTKAPETYYFVHWDKDPQSLTYLYCLKEENPQSFGYIVFNKEDKMIFVNNRGKWENDKDGDYFMSILDKFVLWHTNASNTTFWKPSLENCKWCQFSKICDSSVS